MRSSFFDRAMQRKDGPMLIAVKKINHSLRLREFLDKQANPLQRPRDYKSRHLVKPFAAYGQ